MVSGRRIAVGPVAFRKKGYGAAWQRQALPHPFGLRTRRTRGLDIEVADRIKGIKTDRVQSSPLLVRFFMRDFIVICVMRNSFSFAHAPHGMCGSVARKRGISIVSCRADIRRLPHRG